MRRSRVGNIHKEPIGMLIIEPLFQTVLGHILGKRIECRRNGKLCALVINDNLEDSLLILKGVKDQGVTKTTKRATDLELLNLLATGIENLPGKRAFLSTSNRDKGRQENDETADAILWMVH